MDRFFVFIIGTIIGSFLNVCIYRLPRGGSIVGPPSHCPHCRQPIPWNGNIPVISFVLLRGRCGFCGKGISLRYPFVEILTALVFLALYIVFGAGPKFFAYAALTAALIVATFIDFDFNEIPDEISLGGLAIALIAAFSFPQIFDASGRLASFGASGLGALVGGGSIFLMGVLGKAAFKKEAMGGGDVKLMALVGAVLGWKLALFTFFAAPFFGAAVGVFLKLVRGRETIPYGPYLSLAAVIAVFFGNDTIRYMFYGM